MSGLHDASCLPGGYSLGLPPAYACFLTHDPKFVPMAQFVSKLTYLARISGKGCLVLSCVFLDRGLPVLCRGIALNRSPHVCLYSRIRALSIFHEARAHILYQHRRLEQKEGCFMACDWHMDYKCCIPNPRQVPSPSDNLSSGIPNNRGW